MTDIEPGGSLQKLFDLLQRRIWIGPLILLVTLGLGLGLGLLIGWVVAPVSWTPSADDLRAISDSYALNNDLKLAQTRLANLSTADQVRLFNRIIAESAVRNRPIEAEHATALSQALRLNLGSSSSTSTTSTSANNPSSPFPTSTVLLAAGAILVLALLAAGVFLFVRIGLPRLNAARVRPAGEMEMVTSDAETQESVQFSKPAPAPAAVSAGSLGRVQATYTAGMDNFDASFPLETARQGFLGECGIGVSETVGDGLPDKVTAFDLWLFDKTDVRTVTQILMSDYAFNDSSVRTKLQTKGDAVLATKNQVITLETQSLKIEARVLEVAYASNPSLPPNSYFQKLVIEIATFVK